MPPSILKLYLPVDLVVLVLPVLNGADVEGSAVGEHQTIGGQVLISEIKNKLFLVSQYITSS